MPNYTWVAKDRFGQKVIKEVEAKTAQEAETILLADGYSELDLKEDDVAAAVHAGFPKTIQVFGEEVKVQTEDRLKARGNPTVTLWDAILKGIGQSAFLCILIILYAAYKFYSGHMVSGLLLLGALCAWLAFIMFVSLPSIYYKKLVLAADWYRWEEVLSLVETLRIIGRFSFVKVPESELIRYRAKSFVGLGNLEKGLAEYRQCEGRPDCPAWLYKLFIAGLHTLAKQYDKAIEYNRMAIAENPNSTGWLDLAYRYARYKRDPAMAREALAEADKSPLVDVAKQFRTRCVGVIAYLEGDYPMARTELETAIGMVEKVKWRPFKDAHLSISRAYLSCVFAKLEDLPAAKKNFEMAKAYLVSTNEDELLAECRQLTGSS
jgi:tetratricopeptide (TPR) repeat protein